MASVHTALGDLDLPKVLDAARYVRDLQGTPGWQLLHGLIRAEAERVQTQMLGGSLPSYEKLAELRGEARGLKALTSVCDQVLTYAQEREAEEQQLADERHHV